MGNRLAALPDSTSALRMVVLAGQNKDASDPLAERFGQSHRSLIPLAGQPMIAHVLRTASLHPKVESLAICIEREAFGPVWDVLTRLPGRGTVALVEARESLADSVRNAVEGWDGPVLVTTADHALLSVEAIDAVAAALAGSDAVIALSPRDCVEAAHSAAPRRFLSLRDGDYAPCDVYGLSGPAAIGAVEVFRGNGGLDRSGARIRRAAGLLGLLMMRCRMLTLARAIEFASRRLGLRLGVVVLRDGGQAIDVDDDRSYAVVRDLLESRGAAGSSPAVSGPAAGDARRVAGSI